MNSGARVLRAAVKVISELVYPVEAFAGACVVSEDDRPFIVLPETKFSQNVCKCGIGSPSCCQFHAV